MGLAWCSGWEYQASADDRITLLNGSLIYETGNLPTNSGSAAALRQVHDIAVPFYDDENPTFYTFSGTNYAVHWRFYPVINSGANDTRRHGVGRGNAEILGVSAVDNTNLLTLRVGGILRDTAVVGYSLATWHRLIMTVDHQTGGQVEVYLDGVNVISYTLIAADITNMGGLPEQLYIENINSGEIHDDWAVFDLDDGIFPDTLNDILETDVFPVTFDADGTDTDWTGTFADIDEIPYSDSDSISSTTVGDNSTFTFPAVTADQILGFKWNARVLRTGTAAGANIQYRLRQGATTRQSTTMAAPGDGRVTAMVRRDANNLDWTVGNFNATEVGATTVT